MKRTDKEIERNVHNFIRKEKLIVPGDTVILGLSGGADSVCLLEMLCQLRRNFPFTIVAAHVHHGIRGPAAERDLFFSEKICKEKTVLFEQKRIDAVGISKQQGISVEEVGRNERYAFFSELGNKYAKNGNSKIAVAHHMDDQAETVLFRMARGTGLKGLCGMEKMALRDGKRIIRPLLCLQKKEILLYLEQKGLAFCEDETNQETDYARNSIRLHILPGLITYVNERTVPHIVQMAEQLSKVNDFLKVSAQDLYQQVIKREKEELYLFLEPFHRAHEILQAEVLKMALETLSESARDISREHVDALLKLSKGQNGNCVSMPYGITVIREYTVLRMTRKVKKGVFPNGLLQDLQTAEKQTDWETKLLLCESGKAVDSDTGKIYLIEQIIRKNDYTKCFDYDKIAGRLSLRKRKPGDVLLIGKEGHRKKLKEYLIEAKIPREKRDDILLLADEKCVLWVVGYRMSDAYQVSEDTRRILMVTVK